MRTDEALLALLIHEVNYLATGAVAACLISRLIVKSREFAEDAQVRVTPDGARAGFDRATRSERLRAGLIGFATPVALCLVLGIWMSTLPSFFSYGFSFSDLGEIAASMVTAGAIYAKFSLLIWLITTLLARFFNSMTVLGGLVFICATGTQLLTGFLSLLLIDFLNGRSDIVLFGYVSNGYASSFRGTFLTHVVYPLGHVLGTYLLARWVWNKAKSDPVGWFLRDKEA